MNLSSFTDMAARHDRCFWLDGTAARPWSGNRSLLGWLDADDTSITYQAARGEVTRHSGGAPRVVGTDGLQVLPVRRPCRAKPWAACSSNDV